VSLQQDLKLFSCLAPILLDGVSLTPKGLLCLWRTNEISGKYLRAEFLSYFFKFYFEDGKNDKLHGNIYFFNSFGARKQKLCPKQGERGSKKNLQKFEFFKINFLPHKLYIFLFGKL